MISLSKSTSIGAVEAGLMAEVVPSIKLMWWEMIQSLSRKIGRGTSREDIESKHMLSWDKAVY